MSENIESYWTSIGKQFLKNRIGMLSLFVIFFFVLIAIYAPFLASSKPLLVVYRDTLYFPLFRYLFFEGFFTKRIDIFFNIAMFSFPLFCFFTFRESLNSRKNLLLATAHICAFIYLIFYPLNDPASDPHLNKQKQEWIQSKLNKRDTLRNFYKELSFENEYSQLNTVLRFFTLQKQHEKIAKQLPDEDESIFPTLWQIERNNEKRELERFKEQEMTAESLSSIRYLQDEEKWLSESIEQLSFVLMPLLRPFHWEEDAGGDQFFNTKLSYEEVTRINRKDLFSALIFGTRISLLVGLCSVSISLLIGLPLGAISGYFGGKFDIIVFRLLEVWESMPTLFMLLLIVAVLQSKSVFLVISVLGIFGWTGICRFVRGETLKQRNLPYVQACKAMGFHHDRIIFSHILPNAIPPLLTLLPFAIMGAISSEAGLSFLGLGEEGSCSWGILMDEGRSAFPGESYLLWPPGVLLTVLLVAIALLGDALRDTFDPKMKS